MAPALYDNLFEARRNALGTIDCKPARSFHDVSVPPMNSYAVVRPRASKRIAMRTLHAIKGVPAIDKLPD